MVFCVGVTMIEDWRDTATEFIDGAGGAGGCREKRKGRDKLEAWKKETQTFLCTGE